MCSIEEAWAGQTFSGKQVVSQGDIHKSYMSLPDDVMTHNNSFSMKNNESSTSREFTRGINSKYSREPRVPKINRNSNDANINISSTIQPLNNYGGINPRPPYMEVYDNASGPSPIMTGENSLSVAKRAEKLKIKHLYLGSKDKKQVLEQVVKDTGLLPHQMAYIGDDVNDLEVMGLIAFTACPEDAMFIVKERVNYICKVKGGYGAFRELAELILYAKQ